MIDSCSGCRWTVYGTLIMSNKSTAHTSSKASWQMNNRLIQIGQCCSSPACLPSTTENALWWRVCQMGNVDASNEKKKKKRKKKYEAVQIMQTVDCFTTLPRRVCWTGASLWSPLWINWQCVSVCVEHLCVLDWRCRSVCASDSSLLQR